MAIGRTTTVQSLVERAHEACPGVVAIEPSDGGEWIRLADVVVGDFLAARMRALGQRLQGPPELQVTYLVGWLAGPIVDLLAYAFKAQAAIPLLAVDEVSLRCHPSGAFDGIAVGSPSLLHHEDVADQAAFDRALIDRVVALMNPVVEYVLPRSPLGRRAVWAAVADRLVTALLPRNRTDPDMPASVAVVERVMAVPGPLSTTRRWTVVDTPAGRAYAPVSAACCFSYRSIEAENCPTTCPKLDEAIRAANVAAEAADVTAEAAGHAAAACH